jgi:thioredoxin 1
MQPAFNQVSQKYSDQVFVFKINADEAPDVLQALGVRGIPTVIGFAHGQEILRRTGIQDAKALDLIFESALNERKPTFMPLAPHDCILRAGAGIALAIAGWLLGQSIILLVLGGALLFSAVYDRCPVYLAVAQRLVSLFRKTP